MNRGGWWAAVHGVIKNQTGLSTCTHNKVRKYTGLNKVSLQILTCTDTFQSVHLYTKKKNNESLSFQPGSIEHRYSFMDRRKQMIYPMSEVKVLVTQSCQTLCDPVDYSPLGSSVHGILQLRILEWVAIPFSRVSSQPRD